MKRWAAAAAIIGLAPGCGHAGAALPPPAPAAPGAPASAQEMDRAVRALCTAELAAPHAPASAASTFYERSHTGLHSLASAVARTDRRLASHLLEAMYTIEQDLDARPIRASLAADLGTLRSAASAGLGVVHQPVPDCAAGAAGAR